MSQHKYNDAYNKGFEDGKKKAFDDWVYQCYDELSPKEQIELLLLEGAELPRKVVIPVLENVRQKVDLRLKAFAYAVEESTYPPAKDAYMDKANECHEIIKIIDRKIAEVKGDKA